MSLILSGTDGLSDVDGTAATPAIRGTDANTGIFFPAADTVGMSTGGSERVRVDSSGNVGIGTNSPSTYGKLVSLGTDNATLFAAVGATNMLRVQGYNSTYVGTLLESVNLAQSANTPLFINGSTIRFGISGTTQTTIDSSGNVGIGTASPNAKLQVSSSTDFGAVLKVSDTSSESTGFVVLGNGNSTDKAVGIWRGAANSVSSSGTFLNLGGYGGMAFSTGAALLGSQTERMRIDSSGNLLVGTTTASGNGTILTLKHPSHATVWGTGPNSNGTFLVYNPSGVGVYLGSGATSWSSSSDERTKTTIVPFENALEKVCTLRAGTGRYLKDEETVSRSFLIAQDVQAVLPEAVNVQDDEIGTLGLQYTDVIPLLVAAIKEQNQLIQSLTARITALETP